MFLFWFSRLCWVDNVKDVAMSPRHCQKGGDYRQDLLHSDSCLLAEVLYTMLPFSVWESSLYSSHTYARLWPPEELGNQPQKEHHRRDGFAYFIDREVFKLCMTNLQSIPKGVS